MEQNEENGWPRDVTIKPTEETARRELPANYNEDDEGSEGLYWQIGQMMDTLTIESWDDFQMPPGYEFHDEADRDDYEAYLKSKGNA